MAAHRWVCCKMRRARLLHIPVLLPKIYRAPFVNAADESASARSRREVDELLEAAFPSPKATPGSLMHTRYSRRPLESTSNHDRDLPPNAIDLATSLESTMTVPQRPKSIPATSAAQIMARLSHFRTGQNADQVLKLWHTFKEAEMDAREDEVHAVYAAFLTSFFAIRMPDRALEVWNHMLSLQRPPTIKHWNAILNGCSNNKDVLSMHNIWERMLAAKIVPDNEIWTTYIHGICRAGDWQRALNLLDQAGRSWSSGKNVPSLAPVHGALSGLLHIGREDLLPTIVSWARTRGLTPSTHTYNILLRPIARRRSAEEVDALVQKMRLDNCTPDVFTLTMIVDNRLRGPHSSFSQLDEKDQIQHVEGLLQDMESQRVAPNSHTYTTVLDALMGPPEGKIEIKIQSVGYILQRMIRGSVDVSSHIYVMLLQRFFSMDPPNMRVIRRLLDVLLTDRKTAPRNLDHIFWDRLLQNLAQIDEDELAFKYLLRMIRQEGKAPSWRSLFTLLQAQERQGAWDMCRQLVAGVESGEFVCFGTGRKQGQAMQDFWTLVEALRHSGRLPRL